MGKCKRINTANVCIQWGQKVWDYAENLFQHNNAKDFGVGFWVWAFNLEESAES